MLRHILTKPLAQVLGQCATISTSSRLKRFEKQLLRCREVQNELLRNIILVNKDSDFGTKHGLASIKSYGDFSAALPLANYSYFAHYIDQCRRGHVNALLGPSQKLLMFALTSGTTASAKHIPVTTASAQCYRHGWEIWGAKVITDHPDAFMRKILQVTSPAQEYCSEAGFPCGAISGMLAQNQKFIVRRYYAVPPQVGEITDPDQRYYTIMRLAIAQDVGFISTANPSTTLTLALTAQKHAERLIKDIHDGTLKGLDNVPDKIRRKIAPRLKPNAKRAQQLQALLDQHNQLLPRHYWSLAFIGNWTGGTLGMYLPRLKEYFGPVPIRDIGLLASEGRMTIPMADHTPQGVLDITSNFYEFVEAQQIDRLGQNHNSGILDSNLNPLQAHQLQTGREYYIFLTNYSGLYRYNIGDLIRVTGFMGNTPMIEFLSKGAHTSSITGEKLTENQVVNSVGKITEEMAIVINNFIMIPQWPNAPSPPFYQLLLECDRKLTPIELDNLAQQVDQQLMADNIEYQSKRKSNRLDLIKAQQLPDSFLAQRDHQLRQANHGRNEQFKHRFLYNKPIKITSSN